MKRADFIAIFTIIFGILIVLVYAGILIFLNWPVNIHSIEKAGVFGDSFGVITSLFSALAFAGVVWTLVSQREELSLQKIEFNDNRKELIKQGFENTFFQMLKLHNEILSGIVSNVSGSGGHIIGTRGRGVFTEFKTQLEKKISRSIGGEEIDRVKDGYEEFWKIHGNQLAHYFRFLFNIFRYIDESKIEDKELYVRLIRAQLSNQELFVIYYNSLTSRGVKFKKYIVEFELMDNLPVGELITQNHQEFIPNAGFKC